MVVHSRDLTERNHTKAKHLESIGCVGPGKRETAREQDHRHRPGHDELGGGGHGGRQPDRHRQPGGAPARPRRSWPSRRTASGSSARWPSARPSRTPRTPSSPSSASWAGSSPRSTKSRRWCPTRWSRRRNGDVRVSIEGKLLLAARDLRDDPAEDEGRRRAAPRREGHEGGDHRPRLLQRLAAPGHQGRGQDRGPRGAAHRQRAHRGRPRLRPRQEEGRDDRGLRLRRRHLRHLGARGGRRRGRGEGHERRHPPRAATTSTSA